MQDKPHNISASQLVTLLIMSRLFTLFTLATKPDEGFSGSRALVVIPLSAVGALVLILPYFLLKKRAGADLLTAAWRVGKPWGSFVAAVMGIFCIFMAGRTTGLFTFFMISTVYQNVTVWLIIPLFLLAVGYAAGLGLEAFSRAGIFLFTITLTVGLLVVFALAREMNFSYIASPLAETGEVLLSETMKGVLENTDILLFILLIPRVKNGGGGSYFWWTFLSAAFWWGLVLVVLTALGDYANTRLFPLHAAASAAQISIFGRMDLPQIIVWIFSAFLRAVAWLYCAGVCLRKLFPNLRGRTVFCTIAAGILALCVLPETKAWKVADMFIPLIFPALAAGIPLITILFPRAKTPVPNPPVQKENAS